VAEGGVRDYDERTWNGLLAPARTAPAVVAKLGSELEGILKAGAVRDRLAQEGSEPTWTRPEEFAAMIRAEVAKWGKVIRQAGIQPE
jgi:tripartite-type tricarboxylate transporter receptor subunit TctC